MTLSDFPQQLTAQNYADLDMIKVELKKQLLSYQGFVNQQAQQKGEGASAGAGAGHGVSTPVEVGGRMGGDGRGANSRNRQQEETLAVIQFVSQTISLLSPLGATIPTGDDDVPSHNNGTTITVSAELQELRST
jgi:hypothetical protein